MGPVIPLLLGTALALADDAPPDAGAPPVDVQAPVGAADGAAEAERVFDTLDGCLAYGREVTGPRQRVIIRRFDARWRRCERAPGGFAWRDTHGPLLLDPILEPAFLVGPAIGLLVDHARQDDLGGRALDRWGTGDGFDRPHGLAPYDAPVGHWRGFGQVWGTGTVALAALPVLTSRGNARLTDTLVMSETMLVGAAIGYGTSGRSAEPRPWASVDLRGFGDDDLLAIADDRAGRAAWTSSPGTSTSLTAASTFGLATLWASRHKGAAAIGVPYALAAVATALQGTAQALALREDPTDVAIGALGGAATGLFVPLSHMAVARAIAPDRLERVAERRAQRVSVMLVPGPQGIGVVGTW